MQVRNHRSDGVVIGDASARHRPALCAAVLALASQSVPRHGESPGIRGTGTMRPASAALSPTSIETQGKPQAIASNSTLGKASLIGISEAIIQRGDQPMDVEAQA